MFRTNIVTVLILVVLPSIAILSEIYYLEIATGYPTYLSYFEAILIIILLSYVLFPLVINSERYFRRQSLKELVSEYEFLKKLIYGGIPSLIFVMLFFLFTFDPDNRNLSYALLPGLILIVGGVFLRIISNISKKDFRYYYSKGCLQLLSGKDDTSEKMNYFIKAINSYNKYLKRNLNLQINNTNNIYSKIISDPSIDQDDFTSSISASFQADNKLKPIKYLLNVLDKHAEDFLTKEPLWDKIKELGAFLAAIIPIIISIFQFLLSQTIK